jgi:ribosome-binding protein aMBF1 (putative translation factor)
MNLTPLDQVPDTGTTFADRIKLLIQRVGSATEIARMCGFSEGVVRSWRDGNTDPSRARCVTLARTLGISLVWLVAGEGTALPELDPPGSDEQTTTTTITRPLPDAERSANHGQAAGDVAVDGDRLHAAMRILLYDL